jgi:hypothetical protein
MTKFVAVSGLISAQFLVSLSNYWFTFGLWPKSWVSFGVCFFLTLVITFTQIVVSKEDA